MEKHRDVFIILSLVFAGLLTFAAFSSAEEGLQIISTWEAENLYPSDFRGKPLPSEESLVTVSAEILQNGKLIDASKAMLAWYVDGKFYKDGEGLKKIAFYASNKAGSPHYVKITAHLDALSSSKLVEIPVYQKEVVIESSAGDVTPPNSAVTFTAVPYFFNALSLSDLQISWKIQNRDIPGENKNMLFIQFGTPQNENQKNVKVSAAIKEKENLFQKATADFLLRIE